MRRREFLGVMGGAAAAWPLAAGAQQGKLPTIGFLNSATREGFADLTHAFNQGLSEAGYVDGRNVAIDYRFADNQYDRLPALAADLVRQQVAVIAANGPAALPAKAATTTIPIVFYTAADPVELGLVASLSRPGGNLTGVTRLDIELGAKRLALLHEAVPKATSIALLINPTNPPRFVESLSTSMQEAARVLGLQLLILHASAEHDFDKVFATLVQRQVGALVIANDAFFSSRAERLAALALRYAVPTIFNIREFVLAGGLMSYSGNLADSFHLMGVYAGRILKGEKPMDLPVQQATKIELIINLKTAKALGLTVSPTLLARANEVIE